MRGIRFDQKLTLKDDLPKPKRKTGEALIKVTLAGICRTDIEISKGYMGFTGTLGHEFVGVVEEADDKSLIGCRVVGEINCGCGDCKECRLDNEKHCAKRTVLGILNRDGAFADYLTLPQRNLHVLPDSLSDEEAVFIEPIVAAFRITEQINVLGNEALIIGDGKLGLLIAQVLGFYNTDVTICGRHPEKMAIVEKHNVSIITEDKLTDEKLYSVVIEATGKEEGIKIALAHTKPMGKLILKTTVKDTATINFNEVVINEISIIGSRCGPFEQAIALLEQNAINTKGMVDKTYKFDDGLKAFEEADKRGTLKFLLKL